MLTKDAVIKPARRLSLDEQARALSVVLEEEFGVPFTFYLAAGAEPLLRPLAGPPWVLTEDEIRRLAVDGKPSVVPAPRGGYTLALVLHDDGRPSLVAVGRLPALAQSRSDEVVELGRLRKWLEAVAGRLRLSQTATPPGREEPSRQGMMAWETIMTLDQLMERLRLYKDPEQNQKRILEAARKLVGVQALAWVPHGRSPAVTDGDIAMAQADWHKLALHLRPVFDSRPDEPILINDFPKRSWASAFPEVGSILAFAVTDRGRPGCVLAVNKLGPAAQEGSFRRTDAALLTPFVGLLGLQSRTFSRYQDLKDLLAGLTRSLTAALDTKDPSSYGHSERVARIAVELCRELGLEGDDLSDIYLAGLLHDVGKIGIRDSILGKREALTREEFEHVKQHVTIGYGMLADLGPIRHLLPGVLYHHENWDGSGYPDGLAGEKIPLLARILAVADAYDTMSTSRPFREAMPCRQVEEVLSAGAGKQWDPQVIEAFLRARLRIHAIRQRGVGESLRSALEGALHKDDSSVRDLVPAKGRGSGAFRNLAGHPSLSKEKPDATL